MLSIQNIEAELSYAYLHAVATRAGFNCSSAPRHLDDVCVDAELNEDGRLLAADSVNASFTVQIQLKATRVEPVERDGRYSFSLPVRQYNRLREPRLIGHRLLVVLFLPPDHDDWLRHSEDALVARRCAYWVSLRGAPASTNEATVTVYLPRSQFLSVGALTAVMTRYSRGEVIDYVP
ncbi:MAG: DUF4365 domain-containing protein [Gemmataceae bacterium]